MIAYPIVQAMVISNELNAGYRKGDVVVCKVDREDCGLKKGAVKIAEFSVSDNPTWEPHYLYLTAIGNILEGDICVHIGRKAVGVVKKVIAHMIMSDGRAGGDVRLCLKVVASNNPAYTQIPAISHKGLVKFISAGSAYKELEADDVIKKTENSINPMDIQDFVAAAVTSARMNRMKSSPQLTLGALISEIEKAGVKDENGADKNVEYSFGHMRPTILGSWRGSYAELALGYIEDDNHTTAESLLNQCKSAIGKTYQGYKGGDFTMDENTPVWVDNYGHAGNTAITGILNKGYCLVILTAYSEY